MKLLSLLPLSRSRLSVLFEIYAQKEDYLHHIAKTLDMKASFVFRILRVLHKGELVEKRAVGKEVMYCLRRERDLVLVVSLLEGYHLEVILEKSSVLRTLYPLLLYNKELIDACSHIFFFGSYVAGNFTPKSDVDILFVSRDRKLVGKVCRELSVVAGKEVQALIYTPEAFALDLKKGEPLLSSIVMHVKNRACVKVPSDFFSDGNTFEKAKL